MARKKTDKIVFENVEVLDAGAKGVSVAKADDGKIILIPNVVPGDVVDVQTFKKRKAYYEGKAIALVQGRAAAALFAPPTDRPLLKAGFKRLLYMGDEFKNVPFSALQAMNKQVQDEPDMTQRMVNAVMKALYWIRANRDGAIDIIMKTGRLNERDIAVSLYDLMRDAYLPALSPEGLYRRAELEFAVLKDKPNFKPEQFIDESFYKNATKFLAKESGAKL
jgi:ABC-type nitrate/sulfonate/bicarbonate transport system substrate-binding protein